jgi:hypothetical protein
MRRIKLGLGGILFLLLNCAVGLACTCAPPKPVAQALEDASAVFSGKVLKIKRVKRGEQAELADVEVVFAINRSWKGAKQRTLSVFTSSQSAACGYGFKKGRTYLVYAHGNSEQKLSTSICSRTKRFSEAGEDLKELGAAKGP